MTSRRLIGSTLLTVAITLVLPFSVRATIQDPSLEQLNQKLKAQYAAIEEEIVAVPSSVPHRDAYKIVLRSWQEQLANRFGEAALTVEEIQRVDTANADMWRERWETLKLYSQPISSPSERSVYGAGEVQKRAKLIDAPAALYTDEARAKEFRDEVRLRAVLAADGMVKNIFPLKSSRHGLTESAMVAARQVRFEPAIRNGQPASQFVTLVYDFKKKDAKPYIPLTIF